MVEIFYYSIPPGQHLGCVQILIKKQNVNMKSPFMYSVIANYPLIGEEAMCFLQQNWSYSP